MFFLLGLYTNSNPQYLYFKCNPVILDVYVNWVNAYAISKEIMKLFSIQLHISANNLGQLWVRKVCCDAISITPKLILNWFLDSNLINISFNKYL